MFGRSINTKLKSFNDFNAYSSQNENAFSSRASDEEPNCKDLEDNQS